MMFSIIIDLIKTGIGFFQSKNKTQADAVQENTESANETNREEIKAGRGWRSFLGYVCTFILAYNYIVVPILDYFDIVLFSFPLSDIIRIIILLVSGN